MRLFCAVDTDPSLHPVLARASEKLRKCGVDAKWTTPEQWHLTLKFLGDVDETAVAGITGVLSPAAAASKPAPLRLSGIGVFGGPTPRVVFARLEEPWGSLARLALALDRGLKPLGFHPENRPFSPHITLARLKSRRGAEALLEAIRAESDALRGEWTAREVVLYQSTLTPAGADYRAILRAPLGAPT